MKKTLILLLVATLLLSGLSAMAQPAIAGSYTLEARDHSITLNPYNNRLADRWKGSDSYFYTMIDSNGNKLTDKDYIYMSEEHEFFEVAAENVLNCFGLIDSDGVEVIPMQYGDIKYLNSDWQLGVILEPATEDKYDYESSWFSSEKSYYLVTAYDVYYRGRMIGSLGRSDYDFSETHGAYLYIEDRQGNISYYDCEFNKSDYQADYYSLSEYDSYDLHCGSNQQAFTPECTLTSDEVDQDITYYNGQLFDLQGNRIATTANSYDSVYDFKGDYARVYCDGKYGLINRNGEEVVPCLYDEIEGSESYLKGGYVGVVKDGKFGYVDAQGNETTEFKYSKDIVEGRYGTFSTVKNLDNKTIVITAAIGELPVTYDDVEYVSMDQSCRQLCAVENDGKAGVIDLWGNEIIPLDGTYDDIHDFSISNDGTVILAKADQQSLSEFTIYSIDNSASGSAQGITSTPGRIESRPSTNDTATGETADTDIGATDDTTAGTADGNWVCSDCNTQNSGNFCANCGAKRPEEAVSCKNCGYQPEGTVPNFCPNCGTQF